MKIHQECIIIIFFFFFTNAAFPYTEDEAQNQIRSAQQLLIQLDNTLKLRPYIPYDIYGDALSELLEARNLFADKNYNRAYFKASMARVKFVTLPILAEAREVREKILIRGRNSHEKPRKLLEPTDQKLLEPTDQKSLYSLVINASLERKGEVFRKNIPDSILFTNSDYSLTSRGKIILDRIIDVVRSAPSSSLTIAGHSSRKDDSDYSKMKAEVISRYFKVAGVQTERIRVLGLGDTELMETPIGRMKIDRVEVVIGGLNLD